jgi:hypothetical protein
LVDYERAGGALIAKIFTKNRLNTGNVLYDIRVYGYHRTDEGYLYIKEGNNPVFVTNIDITPKTEIEEILVQRNGKDWDNDNTLYPGETVLVMLRGKGFHKSNFNFVGADVIEEDTLISNENIYELKLTVPNSINVAKVEIYDRDEPTGKFLNVKELRKPREFDFIEVELPTVSYNFDDQVKPIFYESSISSVGIKFNENLIDLEELHGKQYITIDVKVRKKDGSLIELYKFEDIVVCPGPSSPRHDFYSQADCNHPDINLNNYLGTKTDNLEAWSQIEIEIAHQGNRYPGQAVQKKKIRIYNKRKTSFDLDVSFPAGLLTFESGQDQVANLSGVSFALLAQFSFYNPEGLGKLQPFKFGIGFIAIDAFNFASDQQDVGLVALGSIYPVSSERKLTFPLYAGFGWKLQDQKIFWLLGPGIQVRF